LGKKKKVSIVEIRENVDIEVYEIGEYHIIQFHVSLCTLNDCIADYTFMKYLRKIYPERLIEHKQFVYCFPQRQFTITFKIKRVSGRKF